LVIIVLGIVVFEKLKVFVKYGFVFQRVT